MGVAPSVSMTDILLNTPDELYRLDQDLRTEAERRLQLIPNTDILRLTVEVQARHLTLRGTVPSVEARQLAEETIRDIPELCRVTNLLEIDSSIVPT
jgi:osmotically-inducible protein OsmY